MKKIITFLVFACTATMSVYARGFFGRRRYVHPIIVEETSDFEIIAGGIGSLIATSAIARERSSEREFRKDVRKIFERLSATIDKLNDKIEKQGDKIADLKARVRVLEKK